MGSFLQGAERSWIKHKSFQDGLTDRQVVNFSILSPGIKARLPFGICTRKQTTLQAQTQTIDGWPTTSSAQTLSQTMRHACQYSPSISRIFDVGMHRS